MKLNKKLIVIGVLFILVFTGIAATIPLTDDVRYTNLKVLPKNVSSKVLQHIMLDEFEDGLGVNCSYCHAKDTNSAKLDYSSDAKPEKEISRSMMRMTIEINKKFFKQKHAALGNSTIVVTCGTCHNGLPRPETAGF